MSVTLTDSNFDTLIIGSGKLSIIDFWATWCPPCIALGPVMDALAKDFEGTINVGKLNVDENPKVSIDYSVTNLPCVLFILKGKVVDKQVGAAPKSVYEKKVRKLLEGSF
ncbi:MAG: thioredoxin domain-containing protein [Flavipsychrobacter sp.]|nr:thioredoxin domain-containing protein [Flavipsychrobacter sp.]